jgi:hypothetical protein
LLAQETTTIVRETLIDAIRREWRGVPTGDPDRRDAALHMDPARVPSK